MNINATSFSNNTQALMKLRQVTTQEQASFASMLEKTRSLRPEEAKQTLKALSSEERALLEKVHFGTALDAFSNGIQIDRLSDEGAYNLLVAPSDYVDLNHDGVTEAGAGKLLIFPPSDAPPEVREAWEKATAGMEPFERATYSLRMHISFYGVIQQTGEVHEVPRSAAGYAEQIKLRLGLLEENRGQIPAEVYRRDTEFLSRFLSELLGHSVA